MSKKFGEVPPQEHEQTEKPKEKVWLITPEQFQQLPDGTELTNIFGGKKVKGQEEVDQNTKFGYLAFGFPEHAKPAGIQFDERAAWTVWEKPSWDKSEESEK